MSEIIRQRAWVEIDLGALAHNTRQIKKILSPQTELMAVVKADAYGHGAVTVAETVILAGATRLAIATLSEGIELRKAGIAVPILILGAINSAAAIEAIARYQLQPTLCNIEQAKMVAATWGSSAAARAQGGATLPVHLKLDTGMSRLGTPWCEAAEFVRSVSQLSNLKIASIYSHLATADDPDRTTMELQQKRFQEASAQIEALGMPQPRPLLHLANSAATIGEPSYHYDLVRVGLALYGLYPAPHLQPCVQLQPVMQVKARVTQVKTIAPGTGVSYGHQFVADRDLHLAVVGIGYADGVPRNLSNRLQVSIRGQLVPQIGAITMDQLMLDVSAIPDLKVGEVVTLIGQDGSVEISADSWAEALGSISWEILCGFKHRLPRVSIN